LFVFLLKISGTQLKIEFLTTALSGLWIPRPAVKRLGDWC
jgi:hypothetical protein